MLKMHYCLSSIYPSDKQKIFREHIECSLNNTFSMAIHLLFLPLMCILRSPIGPQIISKRNHKPAYMAIQLDIEKTYVRVG